ncbi:MAG: dihydroorotate dehydrogenase [Clostridiales bacterium]|nr:dihydroorotate dehydrogenase [Clostridiales bacterium]
MVDISVSLGNINLPNPIIAASGTFGYGYEFSKYFNLNILGGISIKGTTLEPRFGNPTPRIAECYSGMINSVGMQNPGIKNVIGEQIPMLRKCFNNLILANIGGFSIGEFVACAKLVNECDDIGMLELNVSCPNLHADGENFGTSPEALKEVVKEVRKVLTKKPLYVKLTPNVTDIVKMAKICEEQGADGLSLINTLLGMRIDLATKKPIIANKMGGFSGKAIFPVALRAIYQVYQQVKIPIIGIGGVSSARDVIEMMLAGATAVQVGSQTLINPFAMKEIVANLPKVMAEYKINKIQDIIGGGH